MSNECKGNLRFTWVQYENDYITQVVVHKGLIPRNATAYNGNFGLGIGAAPAGGSLRVGWMQGRCGPECAGDGVLAGLAFKAQTVAGCINCAAACHGAQSFDRTTQRNRKPAVNLGLGCAF